MNATARARLAVALRHGSGASRHHSVHEPARRCRGNRRRGRALSSTRTSQTLMFCGTKASQNDSRATSPYGAVRLASSRTRRSRVAGSYARAMFSAASGSVLNAVAMASRCSAIVPSTSDVRSDRASHQCLVVVDEVGHLAAQLVERGERLCDVLALTGEQLRAVGDRAGEGADRLVTLGEHRHQLVGVTDDRREVLVRVADGGERATRLVQTSRRTPRPCRRAVRP